MSNSYRIRTQVGTDQSVRVKLEQDYEFLEILSLKFLQSEVYTRQCSDYGVIVGRVSVNDGFGIPNAKVSIFIPLTTQDERNPIISTLYPYKSIDALNEDGYRYNLLPYTKSYSNHTPTGTFFDKDDVLTNPTLIEIFDKYFKYTVRTNDSGDFMIFGAPTGTQTVHFDIDLSDIGEFSLAPQDLIRMGLATESQVAGTAFRSSTNLNELPQIISINRKIEVQPLWGQEDFCTIGITRTDVDLTNEASINITPTAIFMGSIFSSPDDQFQKRNCKPKTKQGELCNLITGPGEILAIRQTIFNDDIGRPILEQYELESGGQVIDENGTWVVDVPMNLDYVITNEFGERVLSSDPKKGIPTKGKYRFKIKWNQSPKLSETIKRGYFLVPNIREYGWSSLDVNDDPLNNIPLFPNNNRIYAINSYSFSLDWNEYGFSGTTEGRQMIQSAIDCEDKFYLMSYNKVYTVSQLIDQFRAGYTPNRVIAVKNILDESCESDNNKFPTNDAVARFDIVFLLFWLMINLFKPVIYVLLIVVHILAFTLLIIGPILAIIVGVVYSLIITICYAVRGICLGCVKCPPYSDVIDLVKNLSTLYRFFTNLPLPNLTYPDCELCNCKEPEGFPSDDASTVVGQTSNVNVDEIYEQSNLNSYLSPYTQPSLYSGITDSDIDIQTKKQQQLSGYVIDTDNITPTSMTPMFFTKNNKTYFTNSITLPERLNLFNVKTKYFDNPPSTTYQQGENPGGGYNRIRVSFRPNLSQNINKFHYDNVLAISCLPSKLSELTPGQMISFQDPSLSSDPNLTGFTSLNTFGTSNVPGSTINQGLTQISVQFAHPNGNGLSATTYTIDQGTDDAQFCKFPMDIEYFQVITAMTYNTFRTQCINTDPLTFNRRYLSNNILFNRVANNGNWEVSELITPLEKFRDYDKQVICFLVRGVDPYSTIGKVKYDLSILFGRNWGDVLVEGDYKLNIPIQGSFASVRHSVFSSDLQQFSSNRLYYKSYHFQPGGDFIGFTTKLPGYYSSLGDSTQSFTPSGLVQVSNLPATQLQNVTNHSNPRGVSLRRTLSTNINTTGQNGFSWQYDTINPFAPSSKSPTSNSSLISTTDNRGYFQGEIIDGGSYMMQGPPNQTYIAGGIGVNRPYLYLVPTSLGGVFPPTFISYYYAPKYNITFTYPQISSPQRIIMRSDRLPTSTSLSRSGNNYFPLHTNDRFSIYLISNEGTFNTSQLPPIDFSLSDTEEALEDSELTGNISNVINTFRCNTLIPLDCYETINGEIRPKPQTDSCYKNGINGRSIMVNGCYVLVTVIFLSIFKDFALLTAWFTRVSINFGACRNVWSHIFTNNWINGALYAFSFKNDRFFTSPDTLPVEGANKPYSVYCKNTLILHPTNNFYYRSSPYDITNGIFIGAPRRDSDFGGNLRFLNFPTTIMDLGPRSQYLQEIVMDDSFDGYVANQLRETTYTDVSEILNLLILSRLINTTFLSRVFAVYGAGINNYFKQRNKRFVDGDYAQLISISSELGVSNFEPQNYPANPIGVDPIFFNDGGSRDAVIGIFFSSNTQVRDFISPKRTIVNENLQVGEPCTFIDYSVYSQRVPIYQWNVDPNDDDDTIFGSQKNDWFTDTIDGNKYLDVFYQSLDRANRNSRYFRSNNSLESINFKGYIYQQDVNGNLSVNVSTIDNNTNRGRTITVGAPFHFYFGLKRGKTAWDRFSKKWINFEIITD